VHTKTFKQYLCDDYVSNYEPMLGEKLMLKFNQDLLLTEGRINETNDDLIIEIEHEQLTKHIKAEEEK
jgi:hypothetical protein